MQNSLINLCTYIYAYIRIFLYENLFKSATTPLPPSYITHKHFYRLFPHTIFHTQSTLMPEAGDLYYFAFLILTPNRIGIVFEDF